MLSFVAYRHTLVANRTQDYLDLCLFLRSLFLRLCVDILCLFFFFPLGILFVFLWAGRSGAFSIFVFLCADSTSAAWFMNYFMLISDFFDFISPFRQVSGRV